MFFLFSLYILIYQHYKNVLEKEVKGALERIKKRKVGPLWSML